MRAWCPWSAHQVIPYLKFWAKTLGQNKWNIAQIWNWERRTSQYGLKVISLHVSVKGSLVCIWKENKKNVEHSNLNYIAMNKQTDQTEVHFEVPLA